MRPSVPVFLSSSLWLLFFSRFFYVDAVLLPLSLPPLLRLAKFLLIAPRACAAAPRRMASAAVWQWCGESEEFEPFSDSHSTMIEAAYRRQGKNKLDVKLAIGRHSYRIRHSSKVVGWIRKQFEEPDAVYVQQRVGEASLWRQVQRVGGAAESNEAGSDEAESDGGQHQAKERQQAGEPRCEAPPSSSSGTSASAAVEDAPGLRPTEVDGRSGRSGRSGRNSALKPSGRAAAAGLAAASGSAGPGPSGSVPGAPLEPGSSSSREADPSGLEGRVVQVHGLGPQAGQYNGKRGRCVRYFSEGSNAGRYKVQLVGDGGEGPQPSPIALWPRNLEAVEAEGAASTGTDVYGEDDMGDGAAEKAEQEVEEEVVEVDEKEKSEKAKEKAGEAASGEGTEEAAGRVDGAESTLQPPRPAGEIAQEIAGEVAGSNHQRADADDSDGTEEGVEGAGGAEPGVGAATGALKALLQQRPPNVGDEELQYLLERSPVGRHALRLPRPSLPAG